MNPGQSARYGHTNSSMFTGCHKYVKQSATGILWYYTFFERKFLFLLCDNTLLQHCTIKSLNMICEALATLRHIYIYISLGSSFLDPYDIRCLSLGAKLNFFKRTGLS
jgi:hypothetical protein